MNALGGTRGERNAKPKFAALDINKLYSTSRGESLEPSTQKSAAPRKHGMQSLGKVPSARRPPANLPSLKAEISTPSDQQGTWGNETGDNQNNNSSITTAPATSSVASSTNNNATVGTTGVHTSSYISNQQILHSNSTSSSSQWNSNEFPSLDGTGQYGPSSKQQHHLHHDGCDGRPPTNQYMDGPQVSLRPQTDAASWMQQQQQSAGGGNNNGGANGPNNSQQGQAHQQQQQQQQQQAPLPPQFRSLMPQFMYRGSGGAGGNSVTPPPSNDDSNRGGSGGNGGGGSGSSRSNNSGYNSMLPSFVLPSANHQSHGSSYSPTQSGGRYRDSYQAGRRGQTQPPRLANRQQQHHQQQQQQHHHHHHQQQQQQSQQDDQRSQQAASPYVEMDVLVQRPIIRDEELQRIEAISKDEGWAKDDEFDYNQKLQFSDDESEPSPPKEITSSVVKQEKNQVPSPPQQSQHQQHHHHHHQQQHHQQQQPPPQQQHQQQSPPQQQQQQQLPPQQHQQQSTSPQPQSQPPQQAQQQQPQLHQEDDKRIIWNREVECDQERLEQDRIEHERQEREREQQSVRPSLQQNGHIAGGRGIDPDAKERLKQRREEDQRREMERKQAAARKLQELEQKLSRKKTVEAGAGGSVVPATKDDEDREQLSSGYSESADGKERNISSNRIDRERVDPKDHRDRDRERFDYGRQDRYDRDKDRDRDWTNDRDRDRERDGWGDMPAFSKTFQSNLPPRFQKRKLERNPSGNNLQGGGTFVSRDPNSRNSSTASQTPTSQSQTQSDGKSVPFAQQYDPRFIHSQQNYGKSQSSASRRNNPIDDASRNREMRDRADDRDLALRDRERDRDRDRDRDMVPREIMKRRIDSEEDDRFSSSGRDSSSKLSGGRTTPQLIRSMSNTSQRKTSVSSDDNNRQVEPLHNSSKEIIGSWESEAEKEDRRQAEAAAALAKENQIQQLQVQQQQQQPGDNRKISESSVISEGEPKQILQRIKEISPALLEESHKVDSKNDESKTSVAKQQSKSWSDSVEAASDDVQQKMLELSSTSLDEKKDVSGSESTRNDTSTGRLSESDGKMNTSQGSAASGKESDDSKYGSKKPMHLRGPGGRHESRGGSHSRSGYAGAGGYHRGGGSWSRRGGSGGPRMGHNRNYNQDYWSESDYSEDGEEEFRKNGKYERKEGGNQYRHTGSSMGQTQNIKEGFAPRGEPSRRGRGGMSSAIGGSGFRKSTVGKKIDGYGPPNSKSPFGSNEEKGEPKVQPASKDIKAIDQHASTEDRTKQKQAVLSAGLTNKSAVILKPSSGPLPQRSPSGNMKPPGKPAEETLSEQEKLKTAEKLSLDKKSRHDSESQEEKHKEKPKPDSDSHDTDDPMKDAQKSGQHRIKQQQQQQIQQQQHLAKSQQQTTPAPPAKSSVSVKTAAPGATATVVAPGQKSASSSTASGTQMKTNQDTRNQPNIRPANPTPRLVKPKDQRQRDGVIQEIQQSIGETNDPEANSVATMQPQQLQQSTQDKTNTLSINTGKTDHTKQHLDGATPPVNTIIFENTNYKSSTAAAAATTAAMVQQHHHSQHQPQLPHPPQQQCPVQTQMKRQHSGGHVGPMGVLQQQQHHQQQQQQPPQQMQQMAKQEHQVRHSSQEEAFKASSGVPVSASMQEIIEQPQQPQKPLSANGPQQQQAPLTAPNALQQPNVPQQQQQQQQQQPCTQTDVITSALQGMTFQKAAEADYDKEMKPFSFEADISQLIDVKNKTAGLCLPKAQIISPSTADLNMKIASVKKVWEMPSVPEHASEDTNNAAVAAAAAVHLTANFTAVSSQHQQHLHQFQHSHANLSHSHPAHTLAAATGQSYAGGFGQEQQSLEQHFNKSNNENVVISANAAGNDGDNNYANQQHAMVGPGNNVQHQANNMSMKHAAEGLANNANVCKVKPTQQNMHQSGLGLSPPPMQQGTIQSAPQTYYQPSQFGVPNIPSPPAVIYNSSAMPSQGGLYNAFQIEPAGRSQFSQFAGHYGTGTGPYNAYMTTPPNLQTAPTPDMYQSLSSQFRMGGAVQSPYNPSPSQQLNNPSTMLISSSTNSLMSSSVKPSQQIGAIGSKNNAVGQPYGQQYMGMFPPAPPLQNNSFYSNSAGGQSAFFGNAGATQNYGIQAAAAGMFGGHGAQTPSSAPPPQQQLANYAGTSQFLNSPLLAANAAISQQYRGGPANNPQSVAAYMKSNQPQSHMQDPNGRQLKSPLNTDGLNNLKQIPPQASPPHHKGYATTTWELQNQLMQQQQQSQQPQQQAQQPNQQHQQQMNQSLQSQQQNPNRNMMPPNQQPPTGLGGAGGGAGRPPPQGVQGGVMPQRYPSPIQRPTNYTQPPVPGMHQQRPIRQSNHNPGQQQQPNMAQAMGNPNKHYYGGNRGGHVSTMNDQNIGAKPGGGNEKPVLDGELNKDDSKKK